MKCAELCACVSVHTYRSVMCMCVRVCRVLGKLSESSWIYMYKHKTVLTETRKKMEMIIMKNKSKQKTKKKKLF